MSKPADLLAPELKPAELKQVASVEPKTPVKHGSTLSKILSKELRLSSSQANMVDYNLLRQIRLTQE